MGTTLDIAIFQWEEGYANVRNLREPEVKRRLDRVVNAIHSELRKRLGSVFSVSELADLYGTGTDWCLELALDLSPEGGPPPNASTATDAAFYLYMREASDFAGGRVLPDRP